jgi:hypothetical protein
MRKKKVRCIIEKIALVPVSVTHLVEALHVEGKNRSFNIDTLITYLL